MNITLDCIPCIASHIVHIAKMTTTDEKMRERIIRRALAETATTDLRMPPPEQARTIHRIVKEITGIADPYRELKDQSTAFALEMMPLLRRKITRRGNEFETIVRLVIGGNIIDYGADLHFNIDQARDRIMETLDMPLDLEAVARLKAAMDEAKNIFYLADNCGEAVFDRLLIEPYQEKITLAVRGEPILNDITPREVPHSRLDFVPLTHTGDMTPGISMRHSSREFLDKMRSSDLIIAKGQGNFETLSEYDRPIFFLLRVKCQIVANHIGNASLGDIRVIPRNL